MDWRERLREMTGYSEEDPSKRWQAVFVMSGNEDLVKEKIEYVFEGTAIRVVVPKRCIIERKDGKWHEKIKPLFPGYILLQGHIGVCEYYQLRSVPGILKIIKDKEGLKEIYPEEIEIINRLMCNGDLIGVSTAYQAGDKIVITEGPLLGLEGMILAIDKRKGRAKVKLSLYGDEKTVDLSIRIVKAA